MIILIYFLFPQWFPTTRKEVSEFYDGSDDREDEESYDVEIVDESYEEEMEEEEYES